ncbi:hypothetical protein [Kitasatospora paranensis]|uniref:hypothetical protein n=1 Tax=Kitasatospora paranensis TaxID=258053 RepID=UPI0031EA0B27
MNGTARPHGPPDPGRPRIDARRIDAVVVDTDAVLTDSLPLRTAAWADAMQAFLGQYAHVTGEPYGAHPPVHLAPDEAGLLDLDIAAVLLRQQTGRIDLAAEHLGPSEDDLVLLLAAEGARRFRDLMQERAPGAGRAPTGCCVRCGPRALRWPRCPPPATAPSWCATRVWRGWSRCVSTPWTSSTTGWAARRARRCSGWPSRCFTPTAAGRRPWPAACRI